MLFNKVWLRDAAERAITTSAQTFIALVLAGMVTDVPTAKAAAMSAVAAGLSVLKSLIAARVPGTISPASVAKS